MNAKRFFYVCGGMLMLAAAYHLGAQNAKADWDPGVTGTLIGGAGWKFYTRSGEAWDVGVPGEEPWQRNPDWDLPVPAPEVKLMTRDYDAGLRIITTSDRAWIHLHGGVGWIDLGPFPGASIQVDGKTWSGVKDGYRK